MIELKDSSVDEIVLKSNLLVMVHFSASWCPPCHKVTPILERISLNNSNEVLVVNCDVEKCPITTNMFGVTQIPTVLYVKGGQVVDKQVGAAPETVFIQKLEKSKLCKVKDVSHSSNAEKKGKTAFVFNGQTYKTKGRLCHGIVKYYAEQNPNAALVTLQRAFNTATNMIVASPEMAKAIVNSDGIPGGDFYMKEEDMIPVKNGKVVVWKYWPERYFDPFMEQVKALGYNIEEIEQ